MMEWKWIVGATAGLGMTLLAGAAMAAETDKAKAAEEASEQARAEEVREVEEDIWDLTLLRAKAGDAAAQCDLGELIIRGPEAQRGLKTALKWFGEAAKQDALCGLLRLAEMHRAGRGTEKDIPKSDELYARALPMVTAAARNGDLEMQILLARMHQRALGTEEDLELAGFWYITAAKQLEPLVEAGDIDAHKKLGNILVIGVGVKRDVVRAGQLYEVAAQAGDRAGLFLAGTMWFTGKAGHPVDQERGYKWLYLAADADHPLSQSFVGTALKDGLGVDADPVEAAKWLKLAIDRGVGAARAQLKELRTDAPKEDVSTGLERAEIWVPVFDRPESS